MTEVPRLSWVPGAALGAALLGALAAARLPVAHDEAYYWTWSKALGWSYYDHPPAIAAAIAAARAAFGEGRLALRVVSLSAAAATALFAWRAAREARPEAPARAGRLALLVLFGALMFTVGYLPATPDPLQGAALAAAAWASGRAVRGARWAGGLAAVLFSVAILCKHSSALVALGALAGALSLPAGRRALLRRPVALGLGLGLALLAPWLSADLAAPDGATAFQGARVLSGRPARGPLAVPLTLGALALTVGPAAAWGLFAAWRARWRSDPAVRVWASGAAALVLGCVVASWLGAGELNWLMPALAFGAPAVVVVAEGLPPARLRVFVGVSAASALLGLVVLAHIVYPFAPIPARKDRTLRAIGYDDVAKVVDDVASAHGARAVVTRSYQSASQLRFHLGERWPVLETASARRSQYDRWPRPAVCPGDVVVLAWNRTDRPAGLEGPRLGPTRTATRARAGRRLDPIFVQPLRITGRAFCPEGAP